MTAASTPGPGPGAQAALERRVAGGSAAMRRVRARVEALATLRVPVLVAGEPGVGHDCAARALHAFGADADATFRPIRCGATDLRPDRLAGAFVYLDRVERLAPVDQSRWLGTLTGAPARHRPRRVVASTCEELDRIAHEGRFLPELARCLGRFAVRLPPLRERRADLPELVPLLVARAAAALGRDAARVTPAAVARLAARPWPGNVRELAEVCERLAAFATRGEIHADLVSEVLGELRGTLPRARARADWRQREELVRLLDECGGNLAEVARRLSLSRGGVAHRARKFGLLPAIALPGRDPI
jgi:DNA-binding NtrC family response regulator